LADPSGERPHEAGDDEDDSDIEQHERQHEVRPETVDHCHPNSLPTCAGRPDIVGPVPPMIVLPVALEH
jgi:hypothetical protein